MTNPILRKNTDIGAADAESDEVFLENCFVDTGDLDSLLDCENPRCIVLGRTGTGKTALLRQVLRTVSSERAIELSPEALSLQYVNNSNILQFFEAAGVELDIFYTLLWRHILTIELLKLKFHINDSTRQSQFLERMKSVFVRDRPKERALKYLSEWGDKFWTETEYRTKEFTRKLESDLTASVGVNLDIAKMGADATSRMSEEQKFEVKQRASEVVNAVQVQDLHDVITFLSEDIFTGLNDKFYIVVDRLDEGWVDDRIRFKLIRSLLETIRTFRRIRPVKIIVALRTDLHYRLIREVPKAGFQEEKFNAMYLQIRWTRAQLTDLLNRRVAYMYRRKYTRQDVMLADLVPPKQMDQRPAIDYILDRTSFRPREAIIFLNECIKRAEGRSQISATIIRQAEVAYSQERLVSLADEWRREYPCLTDYVKILVRRNSSFELGTITQKDCEDFAEELLGGTGTTGDPVVELCEDFFTRGGTDFQSFLYPIIEILYHVGIIGVKTEPNLGRQWSHDDQPFLSKGQLKRTSVIDVHKTYWAVLGITSKGRAAAARQREVES